MIDPFNDVVIGAAAASVERATVSKVLVPAVNAAVVAMPISLVAMSDEPIEVLRFISAAGVTRVPPEPAALHAVALTKSIWTGTPAAKNVVLTAAEILIFRTTQKRVASLHRN